jgi:HD-like signal output (HDOD) protein
MLRIVFVDDEVSALQAMQRALHGMKFEWRMVFVSSGAAALDELAKTSADVIVSDMRMAGMDGWQLLREVKKLYPQMVRLVLSGHADLSSIMRTVGVAHQFLAKPCDSKALKAAVSQAYMLRHLSSSARLAQRVGCVDMLPGAPKVFQEILACLQQPRAAVADAARIIGRDAAMTANVIKLVNSAFVGSRQPATTATRAVAYLGLDTLGALVLGHSMFKSGVTTGIAGFSLERLWRHSLDTAVAARTLAFYEKLSPRRAEEAFLAGMLHDVGKVVFAMRPAAATDDPAARVDDAAAPMDAHHAEVGAYLLGLWGFPNSIVEAVAFHHSPQLSPSQTEDGGLTLPKLIYIADRLVHQRNAEYAGRFERCRKPELLEDLDLANRWPEWLAALDVFDLKTAA